MTASEIWRDYFAAHETDQLRRFPPDTPLTPLEQAQYKVALGVIERTFPLDRLREFKAQLGVNNSDKPIAFRADTPTRRAFFEHFHGDRVIDIFCIRDQEWDSVIRQPDMRSLKIPPYTTHSHIFIPCTSVNKEMNLRHFYGDVIEKFPLEELFIQQSISVLAPLVGGGSLCIWRWDGCHFTPALNSCFMLDF